MQMRATTGGLFGEPTVAETMRRDDPETLARLTCPTPARERATVASLRRQLTGLQGTRRQSVLVSGAFRTSAQTERVLRGIVLARWGKFLSFRGQFTDESLERIVTLVNGMPDGLRCRFEHGADSDAFRIGRIHRARLSGNFVVGDLHLSRENPDFVMEVMTWLSITPKSLSSSLQLSEYQRRPGNPKVWLPESLEACDIVPVGDASPTADLWPMENLDNVLMGLTLDAQRRF